MSSLVSAPPRPRLKVCCITSPREASLAIRYGAAAVGLVSDMPSGPGVISEREIREIAAGVPPGVATFLLTCRTTLNGIAEQQRRTGTSTVQLCDRVSADVRVALRTTLPGVKVVQVVHVRGDGAIEEAREAARGSDAILLDSGNATLEVKELGGTGRTHDWDVSRAIRDAAPVPVFLAGGLDVGNVARAVAHVCPFAVDVCSGLRTNGELDESKLAAFVRALESSPLAAPNAPALPAG